MKWAVELDIAYRRLEVDSADPGVRIRNMNLGDERVEVLFWRTKWPVPENDRRSGKMSMLESTAMILGCGSCSYFL